MLPFSWTTQTLPVSGWNASLIRSQGHSLGRTDSLQCWLLPLWPFLLGKHIQDAILTSRRPSEASPIWALRQVPTRVPIQIGFRGYRRLWWGNRDGVRWEEEGEERRGGTWGTPGEGKTIIGHCQPHSTLPLGPSRNITDLPRTIEVESKVVLKQTKRSTLTSNKQKLSTLLLTF